MHFIKFCVNKSFACNVQLTVHPTTTVPALAPSELSLRLGLTFETRLHHQPTYLYDLLHNYTPTRPLRSSAANLLSKPTTTKISDRTFTIAAAEPGITYQQLFDLQYHFIFSLAISKCTSSQLPSNSHQPSPEPLTHHYCDDYGAVINID